MEHTPDHKNTLIHLVSEYEAMSQKGDVSLLEEKAFFKLVRYYENEFQRDKALEVLDHALEVYSYSVDFYIKKADLLLELRRLDDAALVIGTAESLAPGDCQVQLLQARFLCTSKQYEAALSLVADLHDQHDSLYTSEIYLCQAYISEQMKDFDQMFDALGQILALDHTHTEALERIGICADTAKRYSDSIRLHTRIIDKDPYSYQAWYNLAHAYSCIGEYERAIDAYEYAFIINKDFEAAYKDCADLSFSLCNYPRALKTYLEAYEVFGQDIDLLTSIGQCLIHIGNNKTARKYLTKALKQDQYNDELHYYVGLSFAREGRWINAINAYRRALDLDEDREEYFAGLGEAYFQLNEFEKAEFYFRKAIKNGPEQSFIWLAYANFLMATDRLEAAVVVLDKADYYTQSVDLVYCKAACLFLQEKRSEALDVLGEGLTMDYSLHALLFTFVPYLQFDPDVQSILHYYSEQ